ncbi:hypothetical protein GYMLUDRAFT_156896 [Collybiopsis luxurians FD-317 M1]|nr:hypothetical protein GYMLUDRAFT_156896 [Collybiopsis luxurians FD-317 M1]
MASPSAGPSSSRKLTGSVPGQLDPSQRDRLLTFTKSSLSFASFNPHTATSLNLPPDARRLSLNDDLSNSRRIVIEHSPTGESFWRFVPKAQRDPGVVNEGQWPRIINVCGTLYECSQDQWDIYKLDPLYECRVRVPPALTVITPVPQKSPESPHLAGKRSTTTAGIPPLKPRKKIHTGTSHDLDSDDDEIEEVEDMVVDQSMPSPRAKSAGPSKRELGGDLFRNTFSYEQNIQGKRTRKTSPGAAKREMDTKRAQRERRRQERRRAKVDRRRQRWHEQFMQEVYAEVPELKPPSNDEDLAGRPSTDTSLDEDSVRAAAIAESRRKLAELEADRPLWEAAAKQRALREKAEQEAIRLKAKEREWAEMRRAEDESQAEARRKAREAKEREEAARREREEIDRREREEAEKRKRERAQRHERWLHGTWTVNRALERYKILSEAFDTTKFNAYDPLSFDVVPWPVVTPSATLSVEDVDWAAVEKFFHAIKRNMRPQDYKTLVEKSHRRFHPDRWRSRGLLKTVADEAERGCLEVGERFTQVPGSTRIQLTLLPTSEASTSSSTVISIPKDARRGPRSAGPIFNAHSIPEHPESERDTVSPPRTPPPAVTHPSPSPPTIPANTTTQDQAPQRPTYPAGISIVTRILIFFGYGPNAPRGRRAMVSLIWTLCWGFTQTVIIIVVLASSAPKSSPTFPQVNEWTACDRPLGAWSVLWLARVIMASILAYWGWTRDKSTPNRNSSNDVEAGQNASPAAHPGHPAPTRSPLSYQPQPSSQPGNSPRTEDTRLRHTAMFRRVSLFSSLYSLTWFLTANILVYNSVNTCRFSAPHIWWLVFGILCITYLMILEVIILGLIVFVFAPVVFIVWNIFLLCIGRHPLQNPHMIKPEIGKLPKNLVDRIPLVMYIPPPPDAPPIEAIQIPESAYSYPPKLSVKNSETPARKRFKFIKFRKSSKSEKKPAADVPSENNGPVRPEKSGEPVSWEDNWDTEGYPFVVLDDNRAACAICLLDFEEPKRLHPAPETQAKEIATASSKAVAQEMATQTQTVEVISEEERGDDLLRLADAGEGAQPLRLLRCGHVFHKTCLDPWLIDVSGRCPVCQRPVEIPEPEKKKGRR